MFGYTILGFGSGSLDQAYQVDYLVVGGGGGGFGGACTQHTNPLEIHELPAVSSYLRELYNMMSEISDFRPPHLCHQMSSLPLPTPMSSISPLVDFLKYQYYSLYIVF